MENGNLLFDILHVPVSGDSDQWVKHSVVDPAGYSWEINWPFILDKVFFVIGV